MAAGSAASAAVRPYVVLGVSAGIAAYKAVEVCRQLVDAGIHVAPVLTQRATQFVGKTTFDALASETVQSSLWDEASPIPHTKLGQRADLVVVAPATADLLARYANGLADDLLTTTLIATRAPVIVCPAMHTEMWEHPAVQQNLETLRGRGVIVVPPEEGRLAGGDSGTGRLADPSLIVERVLEVLAGDDRRDLVGRRVVITAGGTREPIDPVRFVTNRSSGKQGHALAEVARRRGAEVVLVTTTKLEVAPGVAVERVETAAQMEAAVLAQAVRADVVVMAAAVADFRPKVVAETKLHKADGLPELVLEPTSDILAELGRRRREEAQAGQETSSTQVLVGFAAETDAVTERATGKLRAKGVDLMVANDVSAPGVGFDHDTNAVTILGADGTVTEVPLARKHAIADAVFDRVVALLAAQ
ncbi:MAG TPA: bifunctional phosphopantothenoylcysteine decarboxylase/phosphopantothenate--cysteine ligase CoaBC [Acidimicrobiales bacterium]|nr:bifunctional phosphopantothenoylcysteine decarboxylase/phosphopantothenate--cysteine ligase CoaBC [Acidimicrobiales bacterium]